MRKDITYNTHRKTIAPERNVTQLSGSVKGVSDPSLLFPRVYAERVRPRFLPARDFLAGILPKTALVKHCTYIVASYADVPSNLSIFRPRLSEVHSSYPADF